MLEIRAAKPDELDDVLGVLDDSAAWLQAIGVGEQWPASFSADPAWVERFTNWTADGNVFLARDDSDTVLGCFRLMHGDPLIWQDDNGRYVYLHSLAVRRASAGSGVASAMLLWALGYAASRGADELRLDCWGGNERLRRYYLDAGFEFRGEAHVTADADQLSAQREYYVAKFAKPTR